MYDKGKGVKQSYEIAFYWWQKSAKQGDQRAEYNLGLMYHMGKGVKKNPKKAIDWLEKSAKQGYEEAQKLLKKIKPKKNKKRGMKFLFKAVPPLVWQNR